MKIILRAIGLLLLFTAIGHSEDDGTWRLEREKQGIKLFSRPVENSPYLMVKGEAIIHADLPQIAAVLRDISSFNKWVPDLIDARMVKPIDKNNEVDYYLYDFPWPFSNRDAILKSSTIIDPDTGIISIETVALEDPLVPLNPDVVRIYDLLNTFTLEFLDKRKTRVTLLLHLDTGGNLPPFAVNMDIIKNPCDILLGLKDWVQREEYQQVDIFSEENVCFARPILNVQLKKYIHDDRFVARLVNNDEFLLTAYHAGISEEGLKTVISGIFGFLARQYTPDRMMIARILNDKELIENAYEKINAADNVKLIATLFLKTYLSDKTFLKLFLDDDHLIDRVSQDSRLIDVISTDNAILEFVLYGETDPSEINKRLQALIDSAAG